jgi:hypothetical protein
MALRYFLAQLAIPPPLCLTPQWIMMAMAPSHACPVYHNGFALAENAALNAAPPECLNIWRIFFSKITGDGVHQGIA